MSDLNLQATVSADGKQASAELKKLAGDIGITKQAMVEAQAASRGAADALKTQTKAATEDAAAITRLRDALIAARTAEAEATREHALAAAALNAHGRAAQNLGGSAGQARASMANLGQQVGDVAQGVAAGTSAFTILAQQGGQVAFAMSGLGGAAGRVATFLSGPFGAAILGGVIVLGSLFAASRKAAEEADILAAKKAALKTEADRVTEAIKAETSAMEQFDALLKKSATTADAEIVRQGQLAAERLKGAEAIRAQTRALLEQEKQKLAGDLNRANNPTFANEGGNPALGAIIQRSGRIDDINGQLAALDKQTALDQGRVNGAAALVGLQKVKEATDAAAAATGKYAREEARLIALRQAGKIEQPAYEAGLTAAKKALESATDAAKNSTKAARDQATAAKKLVTENDKLAESYNPLRAAQDDYRKALEDIAKAETRGIATTALAGEARLAAAETLRQARLKALGATPSGPAKIGATAGDLDQELSAQVFASDLQREMDKVLGPGGLGKQLGIEVGGEFGKKALELSQLIGDGLAGSFGRALQRSNALAGILEALSPGQGGVFQSESSKAIKEGFKPLVSGLDKLFGGKGELTKVLGKAGGGAAVGAAISDVFNGLGITKNKKGASIGGQIGGAVGSFIPIPGGALIGSVLGSLVGGLFKGKNPFADARITTTATGVSSSIFNQRGADSAEQGSSIAGTVGNQLQAIASALGAEIKAGINLGAIGFSGDQYYFNPTGGDFKAAGVQRFQKPEEAVAAAVASALGSGAVTTSPRVQAVLQRYASDVNMAVVEALKVKDLEQLLEARGNPFLSAFKDFERQAAQRLDAARKYGFEVVEIEKINAEQRSALIRDTLTRATGSARALLDDFRFGSRASGSIREQLGALGGERDRLAGLVRGGDGGSLDALTSVLSQIDDLQREAFGATGEAAGGRASSTALLQELVDATEARVRAAAEEARKAAEAQTATLQSMDGTLEDMFKLSQQQLVALQGIQAGLIGGGGRNEFVLANSVARS